MHSPLYSATFKRSSYDRNELDISMIQPFDMILAGWWRFTQYELWDGSIRPADGAKLIWYDPWEAYKKSWDRNAWANDSDSLETSWLEIRNQYPPYRSLLKFITDLTLIPSPEGKIHHPTLESGHGHRYNLTPESEVSLLEFCNQYGVLGILPHQAQSVFLAPRWNDQLGTNRLWITQHHYVRGNTGWLPLFNQQIGGDTDVLENMPEKKDEIVSEEYLPEDYVRSGVLLQSLQRVEFSQEPLRKTWAKFFPSVPEEEQETYKYPPPLSDGFWHLYAEPIADFLRGAALLKEALDRLSRIKPQETITSDDIYNVNYGKDILHSLLAPVGLVLSPTEEGTFKQQWVASSLLASFAAMAFFDLTQARLLRCRRCNQLFTSDAYQAAFCSSRCRQAAQKKAYRDRKKAAEKDSKLQNVDIDEG